MAVNIDFDLSMVGDEAEDIKRCLSLLLATPLGSMPGARAFGMDPSILDYPEPAAKALLAAEIVRQINNYEPRAAVSNIAWTTDINGALAAKVAIKHV